MQCDGTGRIQGGLAAITLFSWWPIKAYRPCQASSKAEGRTRGKDKTWIPSYGARTGEIRQRRRFYHHVYTTCVFYD